MQSMPNVTAHNTCLNTTTRHSREAIFLCGLWQIYKQLG